MENVRTPQEGGGFDSHCIQKKMYDPSGGDDRQ